MFKARCRLLSVKQYYTFDKSINISKKIVISTQNTYVSKYWKTRYTGFL